MSMLYRDGKSVRLQEKFLFMLRIVSYRKKLDSEQRPEVGSQISNAIFLTQCLDAKSDLAKFEMAEQR